MKKTHILALLVAFVLALTMFTGCRNSGNSKSSEAFSDISLPSVSQEIAQAEKWTAETGTVDGWMFSSIANYVFYATESIDNDSVAFMTFVEKLKDGRTLKDVMQEYIDGINTNTLYNNQEWIIETPKKTTFGGKESYELSVNYSIQTRAARHYHIIFTQLDDEVFMFDNDYTIRQEARDETLINNLIAAVMFVPAA